MFATITVAAFISILGYTNIRTSGKYFGFKRMKWKRSHCLYVLISRRFPSLNCLRISTHVPPSSLAIAASGPQNTYVLTWGGLWTQWYHDCEASMIFKKCTLAILKNAESESINMNSTRKFAEPFFWLRRQLQLLIGGWRSSSWRCCGLFSCWFSCFSFLFFSEH